MRLIKGRYRSLSSNGGALFTGLVITHLNLKCRKKSHIYIGKRYKCAAAEKQLISAEL